MEIHTWNAFENKPYVFWHDLDKFLKVFGKVQLKKQWVRNEVIRFKYWGIGRYIVLNCMFLAFKYQQQYIKEDIILTFTLSQSNCNN